MLTEDRKLTGIMGVLSVGDNMTIASLDRFSPRGWLQKRRMNAAAQKQREALAIKTPTLAQLIKLLSGGNQQKVLVSRWLLTTPDILMIDEPTRGIDVGAKAEIHRLMSTLAKEGKAVLMVSSELPEILGHERPRPRHARGPAHRRVQPGRGHPGEDHDRRDGRRHGSSVRETTA